MRKQVVVCDMCGEQAELQDWIHLPFRKHFLSASLRKFQGIDLCGRSCEHDFNVYYEHYVGGMAYEFGKNK